MTMSEGPLDPVLPPAEEECVHLPRKEGRQGAAANGKGDRMKNVAGVGGKVQHSMSIINGLTMQHCR